MLGGLPQIRVDNQRPAVRLGISDRDIGRDRAFTFAGQGGRKRDAFSRASPRLENSRLALRLR